MSVRGRLMASSLAAFAALSMLMPMMDQPSGGDAGQMSSLPCNGHGRVDSGRCLCNAGWTGDACDAPGRSLDCGDHGRYANGWCVCEPGWKGRTCQTGPGQTGSGQTGPAQTPPATCSAAHGRAVNGKCVCDTGWSGDTCAKGP